MFDYTNQVKLDGTYRVPAFGGFNVSAVYRYTTGLAWGRTATIRGLSQGNETVRIEPRGTRRTDPINNLDFRVEKTFPIGASDRKIGIYLDIFNINNQGVIDNGARTGVIEGSPAARSATRTSGSARASHGWGFGSRSEGRNGGTGWRPRRSGPAASVSGQSCPSRPSCPRIDYVSDRPPLPTDRPAASSSRRNARDRRAQAAQAGPAGAGVRDRHAACARRDAAPGAGAGAAAAHRDRSGLGAVPAGGGASARPVRRHPARVERLPPDAAPDRRHPAALRGAGAGRLSSASSRSARDGNALEPLVSAWYDATSGVEPGVDTRNRHGDGCARRASIRCWCWRCGLFWRAAPRR